MYLIVITGH